MAMMIKVLILLKYKVQKIYYHGNNYNYDDWLHTQNEYNKVDKYKRECESDSSINCGYWF